MKIWKIAAISLLVLSSFAANTVAPSKSELEAMYDKAFREFDGNNYEQALKHLDAIDARQPDLAESQNLRGVILMRQKDYEKAETALQRALAADPKFWNARFNLELRAVDLDTVKRVDHGTLLPRERHRVRS